MPIHNIRRAHLHEDITSIEREGERVTSITFDPHTDDTFVVATCWVGENLIETRPASRKGVETRSVAITKSHIEHEQRMAEYRVNRAANPELDDDIPF